MKAKKYILVGTVILIAGAIYALDSTSNIQRAPRSESVTVTPRKPVGPDEIKNQAIQGTFLSAEEKSKRYELAKEITTPDGFINTDEKPIMVNDLVGKKVILIDFWTYSCINCQRTTPYLNAWYEKYKDKGFVIIGVHTPEFEFEKEYNNVKAAVEKFQIKYPVVLDNDFSTWSAYKNRYWPRKYLIDIDGYIIYDHTGEGGYEETEQKIQEALTERMAVLGEKGVIEASLTKEVAGKRFFGSPETYFGASRNQSFGNGTPGIVGDQTDLKLPPQIDLNTLYLSGDWHIADEFAQNSSSNARIAYKYSAQNVFFVSHADAETVIEVLRDGKSLGSEAGADVVKTSDGKTVVKIKEARLYKIIEGGESETHLLEFIIQKPGLKAFTFTFG